MKKACEVQLKPVISLNHLFVGARFKTMKAFLVCQPRNIKNEQEVTITTTTEATTTPTMVSVSTSNLDLARTSTKGSTLIPSTTSNSQEIKDQERKCKKKMIPYLLPMTLNSVLVIPGPFKNCISIPSTTSEPPLIATTTEVTPRKCRVEFVPILNPHPSSITGQYFKKSVVVCEPTKDHHYD